jgi:hypothetical protein
MTVPAATLTPSLIAEVLPRYEAREAHETFVAAPPAEVYRAIEELTLGELHEFRALMGVRMGFAVLGSRPGSELVIGGAGQPWRPAGGVTATIRDRNEFEAFDRPGFAKVAIGFRLEEVPGGTRVVTETRVDTTDALTHRRFGTYWKVIRVWSGAVRRSWLRAIRRRAERGAVPLPAAA